MTTQQTTRASQAEIMERIKLLRQRIYSKQYQEEGMLSKTGSKNAKGEKR